MFLEKLEIQGFKSFANKNLLVFPGMLDKSRRGITAIVGPNGSGKSNVADSVRWALGEQSMKTLRGKKSEDIIFSGSDKKSRLGMAEVSLHLNNEDRQAPLDYSQIILTRRLYRDGNSEYLINSSRVRLLDIQILLAKTNFGQKTYSVIGQGMVEGFLNTSLAERKEFFDEATGVKQFQIKRDDSLNKLSNSYANLNQAKMLLSEIEPRLKSLTRQVNKLKKRDELASELKEVQLNYYGKLWQEINDKFSQANKKILVAEKNKLEKEKKLAPLNKELEQLEKQAATATGYEEWQEKLRQAENQRDMLNKKLAKLEAELELKLEASGQFDLAWLSNKKRELNQELEEINEKIEIIFKNIDSEKLKLGVLEEEKSNTNDKINRLNDKLINSGSFIAGNETSQIIKELKRLFNKLAEIEIKDDLVKIRALAKEIRQEINQLIKLAEASRKKDNLEIVRQDLIALTRKKEETATRLNESNLRILAWSERIKLIKERGVKAEQELAEISQKLAGGKKLAHGDSETAKEEINPVRDLSLNGVKKKLAPLVEKIKELKEKIDNFNTSQEERRSRLFNRQKNLQSLQEEINSLLSELNELKINSARQETRLEDLETEIRNNYGNLKEIKEHQVSAPVDQTLALEKINFLKRQLDQIGGIDPEIEQEYLATKERYDFLDEQVKDLTKAIAALEKIIKELDLIIKERFDKEFKNISAKFEEYFKILFNGGQAKIIKIMAEEASEADDEKNNNLETGVSANGQAATSDKVGIDLKRIKFLQKHNATGLAGIELQATPPGKKIKTVAMLSGGERALTAIALICAIISSNPSPFVVLDEVDASLDEANSERLAKILDGLSHKTQFILITHNRASMRRANILYGITMGDDGISKLLSIKLDETKINNRNNYQNNR